PSPLPASGRGRGRGCDPSPNPQPPSLRGKGEPEMHLMRLLGYRYQRTLARPAVVTGPGFVTGARVRANFRPAPAHAGVAFVRTDRPDRQPIPARADRVTDTRRRTTLGPGAAGVTLVEHVLATLAGLRVDNCV